MRSTTKSMTDVRKKQTLNPMEEALPAKPVSTQAHDRQHEVIEFGLAPNVSLIGEPSILHCNDKHVIVMNLHKDWKS
jgi:hypothetical protein